MDYRTKPILLGLLAITVVSLADAHVNTTSTAVGNCSSEASPCKEGIILPMWKPQGNLSRGDKIARATVYMVVLIYLFLGVSIIADRFMAAIEVITSKEKDIIVKRKDGTTQVVSVRIWNETVSNLTLMALGSSAPEILLSIIEVCGNNFDAGELGPGTIVGSAAFNLFIIIAICVLVVPKNEVRRIKHLRVFFITATWSIFAYLWLYFILSVNSYGVVDIWEAVLTFIFFPITVLTAYIADKKLLVYKFLSKKYAPGGRNITVPSDGKHDVELADGKVNPLTEEMIAHGGDQTDVQEFEEHKQDFVSILRELKKKHPNMDHKTLNEMAEYEVLNKGPKSRAFYRMQATRTLTGGGNVIKKAKLEKIADMIEEKPEIQHDDNCTRIFFQPSQYTVMENVGSFTVTVTREGGNLGQVCLVDYFTENGTATAGEDYIATSGTLKFLPYEKHKQFEVTVLDDDVFEEDEHFYIHLKNPRLQKANESYSSLANEVTLSQPSMATVMIIDDDHPGIFHFETSEMTVNENVGEAQVKVVRSSGARGTVKIPYFATDGKAKRGLDYELVGDHVIFENDQTEQFIKVRIIDDEEYEKSENFLLYLGEPILLKTSKGKKRREDEDEAKAAPDIDDVPDSGKPRLGDCNAISIHIKESQEFKSTVDKLMKKANVSNMVSTSSWREQFLEAVTVSSEQPGDENDLEEDIEAEEKLPSCLDYIMHFLTLFWKLIFACVPPTDYCGGWACFYVSVIGIGFLTAIIGDVASSFGCTIGLKDSITAISFVALGTSVPDTFASKVAAVNDRYADSSIGNVTGSNAVNVFLGIGIAWTIAAIYHASHGNKFYVNPGDLAMSVTVFCVMALLAIAIMMLRRLPVVGGELGGPTKLKYATAVVMIIFWLNYLVISSLVTYCYIPGF
ncbi:sodium/calcium exchanger 1 [Biomphalaria pfeifferi]|uniref:Sodium/calcium exchanger 1 n=1 Tax=Biomphalaria pfeifferi TaxID=112525 RepID=A0AAD8F0M3_BIOPF|nr:sodium/calcium exchanger 1 [Biomphalaria pfeifferi]